MDKTKTDIIRVCARLFAPLLFHFKVTSKGFWLQAKSPE